MSVNTILFFVLGGPACGKSTLCKKIINKYDVIHISVGELLMREIAKNTELGKIIYEYIKNSMIVPDKITFDIMIAEVSNHYGKIILIDGYPRNKENNKYFKINVPSNIIIKKVLFLDCNENIMIERVKNRNENNNNIRFDDDIEIIKKRIHTFSTQTIDVINEYNENGLVIKIDSTQSPNDIFSSIEYLFI